MTRTYTQAELDAAVAAATEQVWTEYQDSISDKWPFRKDHVENAIRRALATRAKTAALAALQKGKTDD